MSFCPKCSYKINKKDVYCPLCGKQLQKNNLEEQKEIFGKNPQFVFVYEMLPSSFSTWLLLVLLFIVCYVTCNQYDFDPRYVVAIYLCLFILKDLKLLFRKFKYRNVKYIVTNHGIEYINDSKGQQLFLSYEDIIGVYIQTNLATNLFGYGHILVRSKTGGIYLDYISEVDKVYEYIKERLNH